MEGREVERTMKNKSLAALVLLGLTSTHCVKTGPKTTYYPDELSLREGTTVRVPLTGTPKVDLGQCVDIRQRLRPGACAAGTPGAAPITVGDLWAGRFRYHSRLFSLDTSGEVKAGGSSGKTAVSIATHELLIEWSRGSALQYQDNPKPDGSKKCPIEGDVSPRGTPAPAGGTTKPTDDSCGFVWAVEQGIAIRVFFTVKLRNIKADATLSFGFGSLAAALALGHAEVQVRYQTIGIDKDILPETAPINVTSIDDLLGVKQAMYAAIKAASDDWNGCLNGPAGGPTAAAPPTAPEVQACRERLFAPEPIAFHVLVDDKGVERAGATKLEILEAVQLHQYGQQQQQQ
jgi:hypothetical protein